MKIKSFPSDSEINRAREFDDPILAVISFDGESAIEAPADVVYEHHRLLQAVGQSFDDVDKYFRIVFDRTDADWTFVCPQNYKNIELESERIITFYRDGIDAIKRFLKESNYSSSIMISKQYRGQLFAAEG